DLLDLARVESGRLSLMPTRFAVARVIQDAVDTTRPLADKAGLNMSVAVAPTVETIHADERAFYQVLINLLSNAVKFTPAGGRVDVTAQLGEGQVEVVVADT